MDDVNVTKLISLVQERPELYDKKSRRYYDRQNRQMLWIEICEILIPEWFQLSQSEQTKTSVKLQSRWQNLRSCFRREYNRQQGIKPDEDYIKHKKYGYYEQLRFILPSTNDSPITTIIDTTSSTINTPLKIEQKEEQNSAAVTTTSIKSPIVNRERPSTSHKKKKVKQKKECKERILDVVDTKSLGEVDEDTHFVLSLVPSLRRMTNSQKLKVKMKFLLAIDEIENDSE